MAAQAVERLHNKAAIRYFLLLLLLAAVLGRAHHLALVLLAALVVVVKVIVVVLRDLQEQQTKVMPEEMVFKVQVQEQVVVEAEQVLSV
jgi:uncharacterized membrane protein YhaH (DUF805 family)